MEDRINLACVSFNKTVETYNTWTEDLADLFIVKRKLRVNF